MKEDLEGVEHNRISCSDLALNVIPLDNDPAIRSNDGYFVHFLVHNAPTFLKGTLENPWGRSDEQPQGRHSHRRG
jgi:hypothetical protein